MQPSAALEAILFAGGEPLSKKRIMALLDSTKQNLEETIEELRTALIKRGLTLVETDTELELRTAPGAAELIKALRESELARDLGKASLETLSIILYRGSATRSDIDWVRGVNSSTAIRALLLRGLIERTEDAEDKRRARYIGTVDALSHLGVSRKEDLPRYEEFAVSLKESAQAQDTTV